MVANEKLAVLGCHHTLSNSVLYCVLIYYIYIVYPYLFHYWCLILGFFPRSGCYSFLSLKILCSFEIRASYRDNVYRCRTDNYQYDYGNFPHIHGTKNQLWSFEYTTSPDRCSSLDIPLLKNSLLV